MYKLSKPIMYCDSGISRIGYRVHWLRPGWQLFDSRQRRSLGYYSQIGYKLCLASFSASTTSSFPATTAAGAWNQPLTSNLLYYFIGYSFTDSGNYNTLWKEIYNRTRSRGRRRKQLPDDINIKRRWWNLKEEAVDELAMEEAVGIP
jgi:hypothetical protein